MSRRVLVAGFCGALIACSLTTDLSGLSGGPPDASDGGSGTDASGEGGLVSALDGSSGGDATVSGFCASHPGYAACVDFDDGKLPAGWMTSVSTGSLMWSSTRALSPPGAMFATLPRRAAGDKEIATMHSPFVGPLKHVVVEFDMFMEQPDWQDGDVNTGIFDIDLFGDGTSAFLTFSVGQQYITMGTPGNDKQVNMPIPFATWFHAKVDFDPAGSVHAKLGPQALDQNFPALHYDTNPAMTVEIGLNGYNAPVPQFSAYYDNITIAFP